MYKIMQKFQVTNKYCISVEGDTKFLKKGIKVKDEKGNIFIIESIGMVNYKNIDDYKKYAELFLIGDVKSIGKSLTIME